MKGLAASTGLGVSTAALVGITSVAAMVVLTGTAAVVRPGGLAPRPGAVASAVSNPYGIVRLPSLPDATEGSRGVAVPDGLGGRARPSGRVPLSVAFRQGRGPTSVPELRVLGAPVEAVAGSPVLAAPGPAALPLVALAPAGTTPLVVLVPAPDPSSKPRNAPEAFAAPTTAALVTTAPAVAGPRVARAAGDPTRTTAQAREERTAQADRAQAAKRAASRAKKEQAKKDQAKKDQAKKDQAKNGPPKAGPATAEAKQK